MFAVWLSSLKNRNFSMKATNSIPVIHQQAGSVAGRKFRNLRISLTASCNYACTYCVPDGKRLLRSNEEISSQEIIRMIRLLKATAGITKVRLTGGEPLLSNKFDAVLAQVMTMGFGDVSFTTNGEYLLKKIDIIRASGIKRINVSLDTLVSERFRKIARSGNLENVLRGIERVLEAGISVKLNMVPMRGINDDEIISMLDFSLARNIELRYIELMQMGHLLNSPEFDQQFFGMDEILELISNHYSFSETRLNPDATACLFSIAGKGRFGIIANKSRPFCVNCNRLRLTSNGRLYGCLSNHKNHDLRPLLDLSDDEAKKDLRLVLSKAINDKKTPWFMGEKTVMKFIGG